MGTINTMARTPKPLEPFDYAIARVLSDLVAEAKATYRPLSAKSGIGLNRLGIILRGQEPPATIGELDRLARALGTTASKVIQAAEASIGKDAHVIDFPTRGEWDPQQTAANEGTLGKDDDPEPS